MTIAVVDQTTGKTIPCRIHLANVEGKPQQAGQLPFWCDHFVCPGSVRMDLPPGNYTYEVERGPEYAGRAGQFTVKDGSA